MANDGSRMRFAYREPLKIILCDSAPSYFDPTAQSGAVGAHVDQVDEKART